MRMVTYGNISITVQAYICPQFLAQTQAFKRFDFAWAVIAASILSRRRRFASEHT